MSTEGHRGKSKAGKWGLTLLRYALCVVAIVFLVRVVNWHDHVTLRDGSKARVLQVHSNSIKIDAGDGPVTMPMEQVATVEVEGVRQPDIEPGIASVVRDTQWLPGRGTPGALLAILIFFPASLLQGLRLVWMLAVQNVHLSYWNALKLSFAGNFFNFALPGTTGGDVIKAVYITRFTHHKTEAVTAVFLDRVVGLLGLVILAGVMILFAPRSELFAHIEKILLVVGAALALFALMIFSKRVRNALRLTQIAERLPLGDHLLRVGRATVMLRQHKGLVLLSLLNTLALQLIVMVSAYFMAQAMGLGGTLPYYLIYVAIGFLIAAFPIAPPQGFGVMEYAYVLFFARSRPPLASVSQAVAFALAVRMIQLIWALPGVLVPLFGAHLPSRKEMEEVQQPNGESEAAASDAPVLVSGGAACRVCGEENRLVADYCRKCGSPLVVQPSPAV